MERGSRPSSLEKVTQASVWDVVEQFDAGDGDAGGQDGDHGFHGALQGFELAHGGGLGFGDAVQAELDLGDDGQRAFGADDEAGEVVAGGGFADPAAGFDDAAVGQDDGHAEHVVADGAVADGVGAAGARGAHAADGADGAGVDGEEQALVAGDRR